MAKKQSGGGGLSLRTKDATSGGGTEGALATISEIGFVDEFTYGGRQKDNPQAALHVIYDIEGFDKPWDDHMTAGPSDKYEVIADGDGLKSLGKGTGLNKKSKAYLFFSHVEAAAEEAGLDLDELLPALDEGGNSVRPLEGMRVRLMNVKFETVSGDMKDAVVIGAFVTDEDEKPARKANGKANGKASGKLTDSPYKRTTISKANSNEDIEEQTAAAISALIEEKTSVKKGDLANLVYATDRKNPLIKAIMQQCYKDAWLGDEDRPWTLDKKGLLRAREED